MRKTIFVLALGMISLCAMADNVQGFVVTKTDGSTQQVPISSTLSIKFADGNMVINKTDNTKLVMSLDDITEITFSSVPSAIKAIIGSTNKQMTISDLGGRVVYQGDSQGTTLPSSLHGVYIFTIDGQSHKVSIK